MAWCERWDSKFAFPLRGKNCVAAVQPSASNTPPGCCIFRVRVPVPIKQNSHPFGWLFCLVREMGLEVCFSPVGKELCCRRPAVGKQHPTGVLHFSGSSPCPYKAKQPPIRVAVLLGARDGTRTHTAKPHAPQTCLSTIPTLSQALVYYNRPRIFCQ